MAQGFCVWLGQDCAWAARLQSGPRGTAWHGTELTAHSACQPPLPPGPQPHLAAYSRNPGSSCAHAPAPRARCPPTHTPARHHTTPHHPTAHHPIPTPTPPAGKAELFSDEGEDDEEMGAAGDEFGGSDDDFGSGGSEEEEGSEVRVQLAF